MPIGPSLMPSRNAEALVELVVAQVDSVLNNAVQANLHKTVLNDIDVGTIDMYSISVPHIQLSDSDCDIICRSYLNAGWHCVEVTSSKANTHWPEMVTVKLEVIHNG